MAKFVFAYHGGAGPEDMSDEERQAVMGAWMTWMQGLGDALVDMGNPIGESKTINADGSVTVGGGANPLTGYSLYTADTMDDAVAAAKGCPIFESGGTIEVAHAVEM